MLVLAPLTALLMLLSMLPTSMAYAAGGPAVLDVGITPVDYVDGTAQTTAAFGTHSDRVAYKVSFSCAVAVCENATVQLTPSQADPYGLAAQATRVGKTLLEYQSLTPPTGLPGVSIGGTDATGKLVSLGDLAAGSSGTFLVVYAIQSTGTYATARAAQFYPSGFQIQMGATIDAANSQAAATAQASAVTWSNKVPTPAVGQSNPGTVKPDVTVGYAVYMGSGAFPRRDGSSITGTSEWVAASNYTVVEKLAPEAVYLSSSDGGVYDPVAHTVTWTRATTEAPEYSAAGGWGYHGGSGWSTRDWYHGRSVGVSYPASMFPDADENGCNFTSSVTSSLTTTVTYLDPARTTKSASTQLTHDVSCYDPFGRATSSKDTTGNGGNATMRTQYVPPAGSPANARYWQVYGYNGGNVPAVATIVDDTLDLADAPVWAIRTSSAATIAWEASDGSSGTTVGTAVNAPSGARFTKVTVTSGSIAPLNIRPEDNRWAGFYVRYHYTVASDAPIGETRSNTAQVTLNYPDNPELGVFALAPVTSSIRFVATPTATPRFAASFPSPAVVEGVGNAVPGSNVTFSVTGGALNIPAGIDITPQYVFIAPAGWVITPGSAGFTDTVPAGASYAYGTKTVGGVERAVVVASWPDTVTFGANVVWPTMTVVAQPTIAVSAGTTSVATTWMGDSRHTWTNAEAVYDFGVQDSPDIDSDGDTAEWFSSANQSVFVSSADGLTVIKEICRVDATSADGCDWISDPDTMVPVSTTASDIRYRVTIQNTGNTVISGVVAYDVLPYLGDTGTSAGTADLERGSTFTETLGSVSYDSALINLSFSASTNPCRAEVYPGAPGCVPGWGMTAAGMSAIRAQLLAPLAATASVQFEYTANVVTGAVADAQACNSIAISSDQTLASEPRPVCAATMEADLAITVPSRLPLQQGRPGVVPFTITNHGGSQSAPALVTVEIPAGLTVSDLQPQGWDCVTNPLSSPLDGPVTLECRPVNTEGSERTIEVGTPELLAVPVVPNAAFSELCVNASVASSTYDPVLSNNDTIGCLAVLAATAGVGIDKTDSRTAVSIGEVYSYTLTVSNLLAGESLSGAVVTDTLPDGLAFVSASAGGTVSGQAADDGFGNTPGGVVTWNLADLAPAGTPGATGDNGAGALGSTTQLTVTVKVVPGAAGDIVNTAEVTAPDPVDPGSELVADAEDIDNLYRLAVSKSSTGAVSGVRVGDRIDYVITIENVGTADFTALRQTSVVDDLSDVLDDADFITESAWIAIDGGAPVAMVDPIGNQLSWFGELAVGQTAVIGYSVQIVDGAGNKTVRNVVYGAEPPTSCDPVTGVDESGKPCGSTTSVFAPGITKSVESLDQNDDGTWTLVYGIDVVNPNADAGVVYDLADTLRFGTGIDVDSASVSVIPTGVTAEPWTGSGDVALGATLPGGATHHYAVTVDANSNAVTGTAAASCVANSVGGFANVATLTLPDGSADIAEACASPVEPSVVKAMDGAPVQNPDGTWTVSYLVTVTNPFEEPTGGLAYTLEDELSYPAGIDVRGVSVLAPTGVAANAAFTGGLDTIAGAVVTADSGLVDGVARIAASSAAVLSVQEFRVELTVVAAEGSVDPSLLACGEPGAGYGNWVSLLAGDTVLGQATACAAIQLPELRFTKTADKIGSAPVGATLTYTITATNIGDANFTDADPAALVDDMSGLLDDGRYNEDADATAGQLVHETPRLSWNGPIPAGASVTISYTVTLFADVRGDEKLVNVIARPDAQPPTQAIDACSIDPRDNVGQYCQVSLQLDTSSLASTGVDAIGLVSGGVYALLMLLLGLALVRTGAAAARHRGSGIE